MANRISTLFDLDVKGFRAGIAQMKTDIGNADGLVAKFKVGAAGLGNSLGSFLQSGPGIAAIGAGIGAAGKFALDAVGDFSALGVEVGQLSDATGLSADAASRWVEVAGDIGIESGTLETGIGKLNKTIGATPGLFADVGIEIARTKDGATDVNGTFLNVIKRLNGMKDPAARATLATKLLGKGWQGMSELIGQGAGVLTQSLADVADAKVFDEEKIQKARDFRKATDALKDVMEEFTITMGTELAPALSDVAQASADVLGAWGSLFGGAKNLVLSTKEWVLSLADGNSVSREVEGAAADLAAQLSETDRETRKLASGMGEVRDREQEAADKAQAYKLQVDKTTQAVQLDIQAIGREWDTLTGNLSNEQAWIQLQQQAEGVKQANIDAGTAIKEHGPGSPEAIKAVQDARLEAIGLELSAAAYAKDVAGLPPEVVTKIAAEIGAGDIDKALGDIDQAFSTHSFRINAHLDSITTDGETHMAGSVAGYTPRHVAQVPHFATGGIVPGPRGKPMLAVVHGGEGVTPASQMGNGGPSIVINVHGTIIQERDLARTVAAAIIDGQRRGEILPWSA